MAAKEDIRKLIERLIRIAEPESRLLAFGSTVNGLGLRYSDMDLCCLLDVKSSQMAPSALVQTLGELLKQETKFDVKLLPNARIPIIKLCLSPSASLPFGIACDIGFENRLALENTRLLLSYASIDPTRVRAIVLFLKFWSKCRNINSPYNGTLSSYGYSLLVLYFLIHVKNPPVLPNLQGMPPRQSSSLANTHINDHEAWFFDDIDCLRESWTSLNEQSIAELLIDLFRFYAREFPYADGVISIREGFLKKADNGWPSDSGTFSPRECNCFCIEDPFETTYNVARTVTREGLFLIRGEFMRASKMLSARSNSAPMVLSELCAPTTASSQSPALATLEPRTFDL